MIVWSVAAASSLQALDLLPQLLFLFPELVVLEENLVALSQSVVQVVEKPAVSRPETHRLRPQLSKLPLLSHPRSARRLPVRHHPPLPPLLREAQLLLSLLHRQKTRVRKSEFLRQWQALDLALRVAAKESATGQVETGDDATALRHEICEARRREASHGGKLWMWLIEVEGILRTIYRVERPRR